MSGKPGIARREFLGGAAAVTMGAILPVIRPEVFRGPAASTTTTTSTGGVTLNTRLFPRGTSSAEAFRRWARVTGTHPHSTKVYFDHRQFPRRVYRDGKVRACIEMGMTAVLCYKPAWSWHSKEDARALEASLAAFRRAGLRHACVVLWNEPQSHHWHPRMTADRFKAGYRFYGGAARSQGWPLYYCASGFHQDKWASWLPEADGYALDDYASAHNWRAIWAPGGIARLADKHGKKFGWFEMGIAGGHTARPSNAALHRYLTESAAYLASRRPGTTGPVMWWGGNIRNALIPASRFPNNAWIAQNLYPKVYHAVS